MAIEADDLRTAQMSDGRSLVQFRVRVLESPAGEMRPEEAIAVEYIAEDLGTTLRAMAARTLDRDGIAALGKALGLLLLPPAPDAGATGVRDLFRSSVARLGAEEGLRLRLRLPSELAPLPWEYTYIERSGDPALGFLALDPQIAIVRHEPLPAADPPPHPGGPLRLVAALASPEGLAPLDLATERAAIERACAGQPSIELAILEQATSETVQAALAGAEIFHFAGHGLSIGGGAIALADGSMSAAQLATALHTNGVRLALLGGCETGRRDGISAWGGTAPTLVRAEIPAVIAYQFSIRDDAAIAFTRQFYAALVGGLPIERAVVAGRVAAYTLDPTGREWGAAVFYLRAADGRLFAGSTDATQREQAAKTINAVLDVRAADLAQSEIVVLQVGRIKADRVNLNLTVNAPTTGDGTTIVGARIDEI